MAAVLFAVFVAACALLLAWIDGRRIERLDAEIERLDAAREADADEAAATYNAMATEIERLAEDLSHATAADGDHLSKASRAMCETVLRQRDVLRVKARDLETLVGNLQRVLGTDRDCAKLRTRVRSAHAQRDDAREECERLHRLVDELRCGDLDAFHDGELSDERRLAFECHLVACAKCQAGLQDLLYVDMIASTSGGDNG